MIKWIGMAVLVLSGCQNGALLDPICEEGKFEFPEAYEGEYYASFPGTDHRYSGLYVLQKKTFVIRKHKQSVQVGLTSELPRVQGRALGDGINIHPLGFGICQIEGKYYQQSYHSIEGLWSVSEVEFREGRIEVTPLLFRPQRLKKETIPFHFLPRLERHRFAETESFQMRMGGGVDLVVDNRLRPKRWLLKAAEPSSSRYTLIRVDGEAEAAVRKVRKWYTVHRGRPSG